MRLARLLAHALLLLPTFCPFNRHNGEFLRRVAWGGGVLSEYSVEKSNGSERPAMMRSLKFSLERSVGDRTAASFEDSSSHPPMARTGSALHSCAIPPWVRYTANGES